MTAAIAAGDCPDCGAPLKAFVDDEARGLDGAHDLFCTACPQEWYVPAESAARTRIGAVREIARSGMAARVEGYLVDIQTAGVLCAVYDALSPENRERFGKPPLTRLVDLGWKHARPA